MSNGRDIKGCIPTAPTTKLVRNFFSNILMRYFLPTERSMIDVASREALVNKISTEIRNLIITIAITSQQFTARTYHQPTPKKGK